MARPTPKKFKRVHSAGKVMASIFWDSQGMIMIDYPEQGLVVTCGVVHLHLQDNAPAHTSQVAMTAATEC